MYQRTWIIVMTGALTVGLAACSNQRSADSDGTVKSEPVEIAWQEISEREMTEQQQAQLARGREAQSLLAKSLKWELARAIDDGGPAAAVVVCESEASKITTRVAEESGIALGRTSHKLRNPENQAPEWARAVVEAQDGEPHFFQGPDERLGVVTPIRLQSECTICHGPQKQIADELLAEIDTRYPYDEATGFAEGDLRGWFWFEVPGSSS